MVLRPIQRNGDGYSGMGMLYLHGMGVEMVRVLNVLKCHECFTWMHRRATPRHYSTFSRRLIEARPRDSTTLDTWTTVCGSVVCLNGSCTNVIWVCVPLYRWHISWIYSLFESVTVCTCRWFWIAPRSDESFEILPAGFSWRQVYCTITKTHNFI